MNTGIRIILYGAEVGSVESRVPKQEEVTGAPWNSQVELAWKMFCMDF